MTIQVALDHSVTKKLLQQSELENGALAMYTITLKDDLPQFGFAEYPFRTVEAYKLKVDGVDSFLFYNTMDDYARATIMSEDCIKNADLKAYVTPHADAVRADSDRKAAQQALADKNAFDRSERIRIENEKTLTVISKLATHFNVPAPSTVQMTDHWTAEKLFKLEALQGGKLNLKALAMPDNGADVDLRGVEVRKAIEKEIYRQTYKHDVTFNRLSEDRMEISFHDLKGKELSKGVFGFFDMDNSGELDGVGHVAFTVQSLDFEDVEFAPEIIERGRPVLFKDAKFKEAYSAFGVIEFVEEQYDALCDGPTVGHDEIKRLELLGRNLLETTRQAHHIVNEILPKPRSKEVGSSFQMG